MAPLERLGGYFWRLVEPFGRRFMPVKSPVQALALGVGYLVDWYTVRWLWRPRQAMRLKAHR